MDALLGGILMALTVLFGVVHWQLLVRPDVLLSLWHDSSATHDTWFEENPALLRALRWVTSTTFVLLSFLTGLVWMFLVSTA